MMNARRSGADYLATLQNDGRRVYLDGHRVSDPLAVPEIARPALWVARTVDGLEGELDLQPPTDVGSLRASMEASLRVDPLHRVTWESARAMHTVHVRLRAKGWPQADALGRFVHETVAGRRLVAQCITDAKGDRALSPRDQSDPDAYVRVVRRTDNGLVIRGAKLHVSGAALVDTLLVLPTKAMHADEPEYAIACAIDVNTPGVSIIAASHGPHGDERNSPFSRQEALPTCTVILDDVFVPTERVLLDGRTADAALFVHTIGVWLRAGSTADMAEAADRLVGLAQLVAEANGTARVPHVRDKIAEMIIYATIVRSGLEAALASAVVEQDGSLVPNELYANAAKFSAAEGLPTAVRHLQDIAGGAVVSAPTLADAENPEIGPLVDKYFAAGGGMSGRERLRLFHAVRDLSADAFGGYRSVGSLHGAGGLHAQRLVARKGYDIERAKAEVRRFLTDEPAFSPAARSAGASTER